MNLMNWESKRNDFLIWLRLCYANEAVYNYVVMGESQFTVVLAFKLLSFQSHIQYLILKLHSAGSVYLLYHCPYSQLRNALVGLDLL